MSDKEIITKKELKIINTIDDRVRVITELMNDLIDRRATLDRERAEFFNELEKTYPNLSGKEFSINSLTREVTIIESEAMDQK